MAKAKISRKSTSIDMTAMVDLVFLLITFFMLTIKFKPMETLDVTIPSSIADVPVPMNDILQISIGKDGRVFVGVSDENTREKWLELIGAKYNIQFEASQIKTFKKNGGYRMRYRKTQTDSRYATRRAREVSQISS